MLPAQVLALDASPGPQGLPRITLPVDPGSTVEGLVEVDGHDIYARCAGEGSPTVVYFTGWAEDRTKRGVAIASGIERALGPGFRVCSYERRNTGRSESVEGTQGPEDVIADIDGFLAVLGEEGPFLLLGASFGGQVASAYAVVHPDRVAGIVFLDASTGVEYELDEIQGFQGACLEANREADAWESLERLDNCELAIWIRDRRDREPDVPLLFLAAQDSPDRGWEAGEAARMAWVESWSPGEWRIVSAPHWMDETDPELVADAVREVIDLTRSRSPQAGTILSTGAPSTPWIAYQAILDGAVNIGLVHADGSDDHAIPGGPGNRWHPDWSPDGTRIAYDWNLPSGVAEIAVTNLDGTEDHSLLVCDGPCYGNGGPAWSPDGGSIGFDGAEGPTEAHAGDLCYLALLDLATGSVDRFLEHDGCDVADSYLRFSPDGDRVVFQREGPQGMTLFIATLDGETELQVTGWGFGARPDWSPDGEWIVLMDTNTCDCPATQDIDLYRVRPDGSDLTQLTDPGDDGTFDAYPRWLPDGSGIIFSRCTSELACDTRTIAADGSSDLLLVPGLGRGEVHAVMQAPG